jgi:hypothetical protein
MNSAVLSLPIMPPLSRLEFPLDSWWAGVEMRAAFPRFSLGLKALTNISQLIFSLGMDSFWWALFEYQAKAEGPTDLSCEVPITSHSPGDHL